MRSILHTFLLICGLSLGFAACDKADPLPFYQDGTAVTVSASSANVAPAPADSNNVALTVSWTSPKYATDSSRYKFIVEIDSTGKNFSQPDRKEVVGASSARFLAKELNAFLVARGYAFNAPVDMDVRVISSYANNNERLVSNVLKIRMTPYKVPPKVALPASGKLFIVGGATQGGWGNPVPTPSQEFSRLDETTFAGIFQLSAGQSYLLLPVNGSWDAKFGAIGANNTNNPAGDDFKEGGGDLLAPGTSGWYKIVVDFQLGKFTVTPYTTPLPTNLFIVGDATAGGWNNPVPVPSQQFTRQNSSEWKITLPLTGSKEYLILPVNGDWSNKFSVANKNLPGLRQGGEFGYNLPDNFPGPAADGNYTITVNFAGKTTGANSVGTFTVQ